MWASFLEWIDGILNRVTMYRLVFYYLLALLAVAAGFGALGLLAEGPLDIVASAVFLSGVCLLVNESLARVWRVPTNAESAYITALILALIITPLKPQNPGTFIETAFWAATIAIASKYIFAIRKKHIFNPAALGVAATALFGLGAASWWVGTAALTPFVLLGGLLLVRKLQRADLVWSFSIAAFVATIATNIGGGLGLFTIFQRSFIDAPLFFFAFVMLTEPLTSPPTRARRIAYGALVGFLFAPAIHIGGVYSTPELALLAGNVVSYLMSPKQKFVLTLKDKIQIAPDMYDFVFVPLEAGLGADHRKDQLPKSSVNAALGTFRKLLTGFAGGPATDSTSSPQAGSGQAGMRFKPGQYMEWTLGHRKPDARGNRRYFTLASAPTEKDLRLGVKFYERSSSFKRALLNLDRGETITAGQLAGDFTLPRDKKKKLAFIAGGIGITPFRSMIKYLLDRGEKRDIVLIFSNRNAEDIVYADVFSRAAKELGLKPVYTLTETAPAAWRGEKGRVNTTLVARNVPDWRERTFYISGTHAMVATTAEILRGMGLPKKQVKTDFFPGFV